MMAVMHVCFFKTDSSTSGNFGNFKLFASSKIDFWSFWNCKKWNLVKKLFIKLIYLISWVFLAWTFLIFWPIVYFHNPFFVSFCFKKVCLFFILKSHHHLLIITQSSTQNTAEACVELHHTLPKFQRILFGSFLHVCVHSLSTNRVRQKSRFTH